MTDIPKYVYTYHVLTTDHDKTSGGTSHTIRGGDITVLKVLKYVICTASVLTLTVVSGQAAEFNPAIIFGTSGKFDKSFNEMAFKGAQQFQAETGVEFRDFEIQAEAQMEQAIRNFASRGFSPIIVPTFHYKDQVAKVAAEFPDLQFMIIDNVVDLPNVRSATFREHEGSYLVGVLAGMASQSKTVGFIGGMDIPLIRKFECGFVQGATAGGATKVIRNMTGTTGAAFNDPVKGGEIATVQIGQGADVIYAAAGGTGIGVLQAVADAGKLGVGVDSNQNYMHPGNMLTSMVKRVDVAVYKAFDDAMKGQWTAGVQAMGIQDGGIGWALDEYNEKLITPEMKAAVEDAQNKIISGEVVVHDYTTTGSCPL